NLDLKCEGKPAPLGLDNHCRTVYTFISRKKLDPYLSLFDFPVPNATNEVRNQTNVPLQRLFLMNSPFVLAESKALTKDSPAIEALYERLLQRRPSPAEIQLGRRFLDESGNNWPQYAQVLLGSYELLFVEYGSSQKNGVRSENRLRACQQARHALHGRHRLRNGRAGFSHRLAQRGIKQSRGCGPSRSEGAAFPRKGKARHLPLPQRRSFAGRHARSQAAARPLQREGPTPGQRKDRPQKRRAAPGAIPLPRTRTAALAGQGT